MKAEGRVFQRYSTNNHSIKVFYFDLDDNYYQLPLQLIDISFGGCCVQSEVDLSDGNFMLVIGKRKIKFFGKKSWVKSESDNFQIGLNISFKEEDSFTYWTKLLQTLNKLENQSKDLNRTKTITKKSAIKQSTTNNTSQLRSRPSL